jgi:alanine dehydrogenase
MNFGVPKEVRPYEFRVGLTPAAVDALVRSEHEVFIERSAGRDAGFHDNDYEKVGGKIVYSAAEAYGRADIVVKVTRPTEKEYMHFRPGQSIFCFIHLAVSSPDLMESFKENEITAIAYETIQKDDGILPVLMPTSELAGGLAPIIAGQLMESINGGKGILLNGIPGTPPAAVVIIGAGILGTFAARSFSRLGAQVTVLDKELKALQRIDNMFGGRISTMISNPFNLTKAVSFADVVVCCAAVPGQRAPILITRSMVQMMSSRSVLIDLSIDNGGCAETSHPTNLVHPTFVKEGIIHYCVPNVPTLVARTASYALSNAHLPYLLEIGRDGIDEAIKNISALRAGVNVYQGKLAHPRVAEELSRKVEVEL